MEKDELDLENKIDILKFIYQDQRGEMEYRRSVNTGFSPGPPAC